MGALLRKPLVWIGALLVVGVAVAIFLVARSSEPDARVTAGPLSASVPADCSEDVDGKLNAFFETVPDGSTVTFTPNGCYRLADSLWVRDGKDITFDGRGASFAFDTERGLTTFFRSNWRIAGGSGITLRNMTVRGACKPAQCSNANPPPEQDGYGQHGINLESTASPTIDRVNVHDVLSDGVSVQGTLDPACCWRGPPTTNLVLQNSQIERAGRMLISITGLDVGLIQNNVIQNGPETGVDIEVDVEGFVARDVAIVNNVFDDIHSNAISVGGLGSDPEVANIRIEGNTMRSQATGCAGGIYLRTPGPTNPSLFRSNVTIKGNHFKLIGPFVQAERIKNLAIEDNRIEYMQAGCGEKGAVELIESPDVKVISNDFTGYATPVHAASGSTFSTSAP